MTIKDIARLANVSPSTVSRILNDPTNSFGRPETRDRVWQLVEDNHYTPNTSAQILRNGHGKNRSTDSRAFGCFVSHTRNVEENPFFFQLTHSLEQAALQRSFSIPFFFTNFSTRSQSLTKRISMLPIDAAICVGRFPDASTVTFLRNRFHNIILVGLSAYEEPMDQILCDGYRAATKAVEYLISQGHRRIAYIGAQHSELRYTAYLDTMKKHGLHTSANTVFFCEYSDYGGYSAAEQLLRRNSEKPTAIFCANDNTALSVLYCLKAHELCVPRDISIISVDNINKAASAQPALTTVHVPISEMGQVAIEVLESRLQRRHTIPLKVELPHQIIVRETVRKMP